MSFTDALRAEPWAHDLLATLRRIERSFPDKPRIGDSAGRHEDAVTLGQDPYLQFPAANIASAHLDEAGRLRLIVKFLGLLGPQGALPLATTDEAHGWLLERDDALPRFLDVINNRFLQLFYRAWADARPIAQAEHPGADRFETYVGAMVGLGSPVFRDLDAVPDAGKLAYAGLMAPAARSASRLRNAVSGLLGFTVEVEEFVGAFLEFEPEDRSRLGRTNARLGQDLLLGSSVFTVEDRIRLRIFAADLPEYERLLPGGQSCRPLADLVFFYLGDELDWDVELALPVEAVEPVRLGRAGRLGYTSWMGRSAPAGGGR
ncbi:type VI secretion system baseplate subunit TssG, partial [Methylobacterium trifolii]